MKKVLFTEYTKNMYLGRKSKVWSYFNNKRNEIVLRKIIPEIKIKDTILEIGAYDGYFANEVLRKTKIKPEKYILSDIYNQRPLQKKTIEHNKPILQQKNNKTKIEIKNGEAETIKLRKKADKILLLETIEHLENEEQAIKKLSGNINKKGLIYVSIPVEFGIMFFFKDLGRRFIRKKEYHTVKELLYGLIGKTNKIKRVQRQHKGYDYRKTIKLFKKEGFKKIYEKGYPINNKYLAYGKVIVFKKWKGTK